MVARMRCKASGGREARSAVGLVEAAYPLPPYFPLSPVSDGWSLGPALYTWLRAAYRRGWSAEWSRGGRRGGGRFEALFGCECRL